MGHGATDLGSGGESAATAQHHQRKPAGHHSGALRPPLRAAWLLGIAGCWPLWPLGPHFSALLDKLVQTILQRAPCTINLSQVDRGACHKTWWRFDKQPTGCQKCLSCHSMTSLRIGTSPGFLRQSISYQQGESIMDLSSIFIVIATTATRTVIETILED